MSCQQMKYESPLIRLSYPLWILLTCRSSVEAQPISHVDPFVRCHRAGIAVVLTLPLLFITTNISAETYTSQSALNRLETPFESSLEILGADRRSGPDVFLPASEAFVVKIGEITNESITVHWSIASGYYLYRDKFHFSLIGEADQQVLGPAHLPTGQMKDDLSFGHVEVFYRQVQAVIPWRWDVSSSSYIALDITYQGCADQGLCYPPVTTVLTLHTE